MLQFNRLISGKSILILLICFSLISAFQCQRMHFKNFRITLKPDGKVINNFGPSEMEAETKILKNRLKAWDASDIEVKFNPSYHSIEITFRMLPEDSMPVKNLLETTGNFSIYETYNLIDIFKFLNEADITLHSITDQSKKTNPNPLFAALNTPSNEPSARRPVIGYVPGKDTLAVDSLLKLPGLKKEFPPSFIPLWSSNASENNSIELYAIKGGDLPPYSPVLSGNFIDEASVDVDSRTGLHVINMKMNKQAAADWKEVTKRNIGRAVALVMDGKVLVAPNVMNEIQSGACQISGNINKEEAKLMAAMLRSGSLPFPAKVVKFEKVD
jgi:hypothetical protein